MILPTDLFYLNESFLSFQGEGPYTGKRAFFLRFHFCPFTCKWCDTKYTWLKKSGKFHSKSIDDLQGLIQSHEVKHVILTGGEPCLHRLDAFMENREQIHIETSGGILPTEPIKLTLSDGTMIEREAMDERVLEKYIWVVSPKLASSGVHAGIDQLDYWQGLPNAYFKFVISSFDQELEEIEHLVKKHRIDKDKVYLSLEGKTREALLQPEIVERILQSGWNFSTRLHVLLWGTQRQR